MQAAWMLAAAFFFSSMGVCVKYAAAHFTPLEIIFYRGLFGMLYYYFVTHLERRLGTYGRFIRLRFSRFWGGFRLPVAFGVW